MSRRENVYSVPDNLKFQGRSDIWSRQVEILHSSKLSVQQPLGFRLANIIANMCPADEKGSRYRLVLETKAANPTAVATRAS
jgi:hypothetical protein